MADETIKVGDTVQLKSGSPTMTVTGTDNNSAWCTWYDFNSSQWNFEMQFPLVALTNDFPGR